MTSSKAVSGARRVFRLEAVLEAGVEELHDLLFLKVEEMHRWNPSVQQVKVSFPTPGQCTGGGGGCIETPSFPTYMDSGDVKNVHLFL